jgi:hypothetical protein
VRSAYAKGATRIAAAEIVGSAVTGSPKHPHASRLSLPAPEGLLDIEHMFD